MALESSFEPKPFGRYVLLEKLAVGGMAEIYKAKTYGVDGFEKQLAIKRILPHCVQDKEFITMLIDEAKLTVLLSHANIVQVFDLGKVGDDYFISMEFIHGTNLRELIGRYNERGEKIGEDTAVYLTSEICKGLDYAHRKTDSQGNPLNIVHRDISPQNVLISYEGEIKIVDFGIAKAAMNISHTMAGVLKGKIAYMSPEQALGKPIDSKTDVFSAGLILYEMLTGEKLFTGETQFEVLNRIRTTRINAPMLPDSISGPLKTILARSLAYNPKDRYQTAGDFQLDLTKYLYSSYLDFSPRQLAAILNRLFEKEIKKREPVVSIDEGTRSVLVKEAGKESIVVKGAEPIGEAKPIDTAVTSGVGMKKKVVKPLAWGAALLALVVAGYFGWNQFFKPPSGPTEGGRQPGARSTTERPPAEELGSLDIVTNPPGAKVFVNDQDTGQVTPAKIGQLALGDEYQVKLMKENYREVSKTVAVTGTAPVPIQETLQALAKGVIEITSNPPGARVILNDRETGLVTPTRIENLEVPKGYTLKLAMANYYDWASSVEVKTLDPVKLQAVLNPSPAAPAPSAAPPQPPVAATPSPATPPATPPPAPVTPAPEPQRLTYGNIEVRSNPPQARVIVDGRDTGRVTPTKLEKLEAGKSVSIRLEKEGFENFAKTFRVQGDKTTPLVASLKKIEISPPPSATPEPTAPPPEPARPPVEEPRPSGRPAAISVDSEPSGAEVYINAEYKGTTPAKIKDVSPGPIKLVLSKEGYLKYSTSIDLSPGESKSLGKIPLGGLYGEVSIRSTPPRAQVAFDGESIGARTPVTIRRVPRDRTHTVRITLDGYRDWETSFDLKDKEEKRYDVLLEKQ